MTSNPSVSANLPLLASQAAVEFDLAIQGEMGDFTAAKQLSLYLETLPDLSDLSEIGIVGRALAETQTSGVSTVDQVRKTVGDLTRLLQDLPNCGVDDLKKLRDFCSALANSLLAYKRSTTEIAQGNKFKR